MAKKKYELTDEHRAQLKPWADKWIANAMSTKQMDDTDRAAMRTSIVGLYEAAGLKPPPQHRIIFVPSPFVAAFAGGFAAGIWWKRGNKDKDAKKYDNLVGCDEEQLSHRTELAMRLAIQEDPMKKRSKNKLKDIVQKEKKMGRWYVFPEAPDILAETLDDKDFLLQCAAESWKMRDGGNQWGGWVAFISFFRHVAKLDIDYSKWQHYELAAIHGGPRIMHEKFCIVSDRPETLMVDAQNRPHNDTGAFCKWRDGSALYAVHGVRVPAFVIAEPEKITVDIIHKEKDVEVKRIMIDKFGVDRYLDKSGSKTVDMDAGLNIKDSSLRALMEDSEGMKWLVGTDGSTTRVYHMSVPREVKTPRDAHNAIAGFDENRIISES